MTGRKDTESLAGGWQYSAGLRHARANQLGNCPAGQVKAAEAGILRQCAQELEAAPLPARAPEIGRLVQALSLVPGGPDVAGERMNLLTQWLDSHGYDLSGWHV